MTTPSVPRCGRMDEHEPHVWTRPVFVIDGLPIPTRFDCPGDVTTEMDEQRRLDAELARQRHEEWYS